MSCPSELMGSFIFKGGVVMKKPSENTSEKNKMKIIVNGHEVTLCFAEKANPKVAAIVKQALLNSYTMQMK